MRQIMLDTETTGLDPSQGHRVVELGCVEVVNRSLTGSHLHLYLNPDRDSDPDALRIHGLTTEFLSNHPHFEDIAQQLVDYVKDAEVIIHNASFDTRFLSAELARVGLPAFDTLCAKVTDSLQYARDLYPGKRNSLDALCERHGISNAHRTLHGALLDSELLAEVWLAMTRGQDALIMDFDETGGAGEGGQVLKAFDPSVLKVLAANKEELQAHEQYLNELDKAVGTPCAWRQVDDKLRVQ